jgi:hypothetical protein
VRADRARTAGVTVLVVALLALLGASTAALLRAPAPPEQEPTLAQPAESPEPVPESPTPSPARTARQPPATPVPSLDELVAQVSALRGLAAREPLQSGLVSTSELAAIVSELAFTEIDPVEIEADERLLVALRLVPPDTDLLQVIEDLYREQIVGLYVPEDKTLYVRGASAELSPFERYTAAHEVVHALQDQTFGLEDLRDIPDEESDRALAVLALVEGDAVITQQLWALEHQTTADRDRVRAAALATGGEALARAPRYIREALAFPYREGAAFAQALHEQGGFAALDAAYADPPTSTAQIYHPKRYFDRRGPVPVTVSETPGAGWEAPRNYELGEFDLRELMQPLGSATATAVGTGWAGGRVRAWQRGADIAAAVGFVFDTPQDADEACSAVPRWFSVVADSHVTEPGLMTGDGDWMSWSCTDAEVRFGIAPDRETATALGRPG